MYVCYVYRDIKSLHGWKLFTQRSSLWGVLTMRMQKRMRRMCAAWIVAPVFVLTACHLIASTGSFRFAVTFTMMLSDWKIFRNL